MEDDEKTDRIISFKQRLKVIGRTIVCQSCKTIAEVYCACGARLCLVHAVSHKCMILEQNKFNDDILDALK